MNSFDLAAVIQNAKAAKFTHIDVPNGNYTIGPCVVDNYPCCIRFGRGVYTFVGGGITVHGNKSVQIEGISAQQTQLRAGNGTETLVRYSGVDGPAHIDGVSAGIRTTAIRRLTLNGAGNAAHGVLIPDVEYGVFSMYNGRTIYQEIEVCQFLEAGIKQGASAYFSYFDGCQFDSNAIGVETGRYTDATFIKCVWGIHDIAGVKSAGTQQRFIACSFTLQSGTAPDILFTDGIDYGTAQIGPGCYFGNEGDNSGRYNIVITSDDKTKIASQISIIGNFFYGNAGQKCIKIDTAHQDLRICENFFTGYSLVVDDGFQLFGGAKIGRGVYRGNTVSQYVPTPCVEFLRGGVGFVDVEYSATGPGVTIPNKDCGLPHNRFRYSTDLVSVIDAYSWSGSLGVVAEPGHPDGAGGMTAFRLSRDGSSAWQNFRATIDTHDLRTDTGELASGACGRAVFEVNLKKDTTELVTVTVRDETIGAVLGEWHLTLAGFFKRFTLVATGLDPSHNIRFTIYPCGAGIAQAGAIFIEKPSCSDFGCEYVATP